MTDLGRSFAPGVALRLLGLYLVLVVAIPSKLIFGPLGAAGTPAGVLGILLALLCGIRAIYRRRPVSWQPVPVALGLVVASLLVSYVMVAIRPVDGVELRAADRGLLALVGWVGLVLTAGYGLRTFGELETLARRIALAGGVLATIGLAQFVSGQPLVDVIQIPGLRANSDLQAVIARGGLNRPAGTALHPIEFGAALTLILPIALHVALHDRTHSNLRRWYPVLAIGLAVPISISRSALISAVVALLVVLPTWTKQRRHRAYVVIVGLVGVVYMAVPGLLGTLGHLFTGISNDDSAASRTGSYALAETFVERSPWFGRGYGTFLPAYRILDNQYLGLAIDVGLVGLVLVLGLFLTSIVSTVRARRRCTDPARRDLAQSLAASVAASAASLALYDGLSFPMAAGLLFLAVGCCAAFRRLVHEELEPDDDGARPAAAGGVKVPVSTPATVLAAPEPATDAPVAPARPAAPVATTTGPAGASAASARPASAADRTAPLAAALALLAAGGIAACRRWLGRTR